MRQAIMCVSRELLKSMLPFGATPAELNKWLAGHHYGELHCALKLPGNALITGVSTHYAFDRDEIAFRIECADFAETQPRCLLPQVNATYETTAGGVARFIGWDGPAVETQSVSRWIPESSQVEFLGHGFGFKEVKAAQPAAPTNVPVIEGTVTGSGFKEISAGQLVSRKDITFRCYAIPESCLPAAKPTQTVACVVCNFPLAKDPSSVGDRCSLHKL